MKRKHRGQKQANDLRSRWSTAIQMKVLLGEDPFMNGVLQGIHGDLADSIANDEGTTWPEVYSFLLADMAKSLRKMADKGLDYDDTKSERGGRENASPSQT